MRIALLANPDMLHARRWAEYLRDRGHTLLMIADPHARARVEGIETAVPRWNLASNILAFKLTPRPHGNALWKFLHYRPILRRFKPEVVHGFEAYYNGLATAWAGPYPKVLTPWGKDVHEDARQGPLWRWMIQRALRAADCLTTNDETMGEFLFAEYGVPLDRTRAFSWGVDLSIFHPNRSEGAESWRARLDIPATAPIIFAPRKFHPYWGAEATLEAMPELLRAEPRAVLILAANEDKDGFRTKMKLRAETLGVAPSLRCIEHWLEPADMADLFNLANAFLSVPRGDLLAMSVLEGMACGCFPVLADHPAYRKHAPLVTGSGPNAAIISDAASPEAIARATIEALRDASRMSAAREFNIRHMRGLEDATVNMAQIDEVYAAAIERFQRTRALQSG